MGKVSDLFFVEKKTKIILKKGGNSCDENFFLFQSTLSSALRVGLQVVEQA